MTLSKEQRRALKGIEKSELNSIEKEMVERLVRGDKLSGKDGILIPLIKRIVEASLEGELTAHLEDEKAAGKSNRKNGLQSKQVQTEHGPMELETRRDRLGSFEPELIKKRQTVLGKGLDDSILSMYARGMSYTDIREHVEDMYGLELSKGKLSAITDQVIPAMEEWRNRPLEAVYPIIWMDCIHYKIREEGRTISQAVYCILGVDCQGRKDLLGLYASENEGAHFWLSVLSDLQHRGLRDILIACIDNLTGFADAIESTFPDTEVQLCIVHQVRNSLKYVASKDQKTFMKDLKKVYQAGSKDSAENLLDELDKKWGEKYPVVILSWRNNWERLSQYFKYPPEIRRIIYTTNTVEGFNRQLRKVTKSKGVFPNEQALLKMLFLASQNIMKKWTSVLQNWALSAQQLAIYFGDRMHLNLNMG
jgi:transposase-like protein